MYICICMHVCRLEWERLSARKRQRERRSGGGRHGWGDGGFPRGDVRERGCRQGVIAPANIYVYI